MSVDDGFGDSAMEDIHQPRQNELEDFLGEFAASPNTPTIAFASAGDTFRSNYIRAHSHQTSPQIFSSSPRLILSQLASAIPPSLRSQVKLPCLILTSAIHHVLRYVALACRSVPQWIVSMQLWSQRSMWQMAEEMKLWWRWKPFPVRRHRLNPSVLLKSSMAFLFLRIFPQLFIRKNSLFEWWLNYWDRHFTATSNSDFV